MMLALLMYFTSCMLLFLQVSAPALQAVTHPSYIHVNKFERTVFNNFTLVDIVAVYASHI